MNSRFGSLCQTFEDQKQNVQVCDSVLLQFIRSTPVDSDTLSALALDPLLSRFLKIVFKTITREQFPSPSEGPIPQLQIQVLQYLTTLAFNNPDLLSAIAAAAPMDDIPGVFFGRNISSDRIVDPQSSHLLSSLRFLLAVSCSHSVIVSSTGSLHTLFAGLFSLFPIQPLCALAVGIISGFAHNNPTACAFIKSLPNFGKLKSELVSLLSSNDHNIVVAAASAITGLFDVGSDCVTLMRLATRAVVSPPSLPMSTALATWSILDLIQAAALSPKNFADIVQAMLSASGMRGLQIITLLSELHRMGLNCMSVIRAETLLSPILRYIISSKYDYVTAAGTQYVQNLIEDEENIPFDSEITNLFQLGLDTATIASPNLSLIRLESILLLLRVMIKADGYSEKLTQILSANQANLFMGLQRNIEGNHSFVAVSYFLFLIDCLKFKKSWNTELLHVVAGTQFASLLVHVMTHSANRVIVSDACKAAVIISNGFTETEQFSPLLDSLVSGFLVMNKAESEERRCIKDSYESTRCELGQRIKEHMMEKDEMNQRFEEVAKAKTNADALITSTGSELAVAREQIEHLKEKLRKKSSKSKSLKGRVSVLEKEVAELKVELQHREQSITDLNQTTAVLKTRLKGFKDVESQLKDVTIDRNDVSKENSQLKSDLETTKQIAEANAKIAENEKTGRRQTETKLYEVSNQLSAVTIKLHEQEVLGAEAEKQLQRMESLIKKKSERIAAAEEINRNLRNEVTSLQDQLREAGKVAKQQKKKLSELQTQLADAESRNKDHDTLCQFIHKITENKGIFIQEEDTFDALSSSSSTD